jgi:hypothetical protein
VPFAKRQQLRRGLRLGEAKLRDERGLATTCCLRSSIIKRGESIGRQMLRRSMDRCLNKESLWDVHRQGFCRTRVDGHSGVFCADSSMVRVRALHVLALPDRLLHVLLEREHIRSQYW